MKNRVCIVLCLCSALVACNRENPKTTGEREIDPAAAYLARFDRNGDPVDLLRALETAKGFNRALALERLQLKKEAIHAWSEVAKERPAQAGEAREHISRLQRSVPQWNASEAQSALKHRDEAALTRIARAFPIEAARYFETIDLLDRDGARLFAKALAATGERFPQAVVDAIDRTKDRAALERGLAALKARDFQRAATLLERAGNPLHIAALYDVGATAYSLPAIDQAIRHLKPGYYELSSRLHMFRANLLESDGRYLDAHADYEKAFTFARQNPTAMVEILLRRGGNFVYIGAAETAFRDVHRALMLSDRVADIDPRHQAYGTAALVATQLGYPRVALDFQNAAVELIQETFHRETVKTLKHNLAVALRARSEIHAELGRDEDAVRDLDEAAGLAEAAELTHIHDLLRMRVLDVRGQILLKRRPYEAAAAFSEAIALSKEQDSTYRAILHFQRAAALRSMGDPRADDESAKALEILTNEVRRALTTSPETASEPLWTPYFSRFRSKHDDLVERRITAGDIEGALVYAEQVRAFEPMQILLQSRSGLRTIATAGQARVGLPEDTVILQFFVRPERTYTWVITRERIELVQQRAGRRKIEGWVKDALAGVAAQQRDPFTRVMRAVYGELFREPLARAGAAKTRIVIVPDEPMQSLPFNALRGTQQEGYLIERASIATSGSTSQYLYTLARDRQLAKQRNPSVLLVGDPAFNSKLFPRLPYARAEVEDLARDHYRGAAVLMDTAATVRRFLAATRNASIIHFAGHALANPQLPWQSRLLLAPEQGESGELNAEKLMRELPPLERTRLVVLGACSTAGGSSVGPQGLAPLVRPLIAAGVPAVAGTLWNVKDASAKKLLVSLHCHYRRGDDVAVALRHAQLERLRNHDPAMTWAAFQVAGYAASPWPRSVALEEPHSEHVCTQNSLLGPDGLHPQ